MPLPGADKADLATAKRLLRHGSHSFFAASLLLPKRVRNPAIALYAFCRVADDAVDLGADRVANLHLLEARLQAVYCGKPEPSPVDRAFAAAVAAHHIPYALPAALIEGLAWDAAGRRYRTFSELLDYAARVAGSVGVMMGLIMGVRDAVTLARAAELGMAMQLTNIARDIGEDARAGRLYLPLDWLAEAGVDAAAFLAAPRHGPRIAGLAARLLDEADALYGSGARGICRLPRGCRIGIAAARRIYAAIGARLAEDGYNSIDRRAHVTSAGKLILLTRAMADSVVTMPGAAQAPLPQVEFLLAAVPPKPAFATPRHVGSVDKIFDLFERLERAQRTDGLA